MEQRNTTGEFMETERQRLETETRPEPPGNPPGIARGECDAEETEEPTCDVEITAQVEDQVLEETMPGFGISGYEGEEDGGA